MELSGEHGFRRTSHVFDAAFQLLKLSEQLHEQRHSDLALAINFRLILLARLRSWRPREGISVSADQEEGVTLLHADDSEGSSRKPLMEGPDDAITLTQTAPCARSSRGTAERACNSLPGPPPPHALQARRSKTYSAAAAAAP